MELPSTPGRQRMLVYGQYVRDRNRRYVNPYTNNIRADSYESFVSLEPVRIGLTVRQMFNSSVVETFSKGSCSFCPVCQDKIQPSDIVRVLLCRHIFHVNCIDRWLSDSVMCPLCKIDLRAK